MPAYGVSPAGFLAKPYQAILADYQASWLATVSPTADLSPTTPEGQILAIVAANDASLWELAQAAWNAYNRADVEGAGLDNLGDLQGVPREGQSYTQVYASLTLAAAYYPAGTLVASVAGTPTLTFTNVGPVLSPGGVVSVLMQAETIGPTPSINPATLTQIAAPVAGWTAVTNAAAQSQLGADAEPDAHYVIRQIRELAGPGANTSEAMVAAFVALGAAQTPPVSVTAEVIENSSDFPVTYGTTLTLPPHSFAPIVYVPAGETLTAAQIAAVIYANKPSGIASYGTQDYAVLDPVLGEELVFFTTPIAARLEVTVTVVLRQGFQLADVSASIRTALVAASVAPTPATGATPPGQLLPGAPVIASQLASVCMGVPGVLDVQGVSLTLPTLAPPRSSSSTTAVVLEPIEVATLVGSDVTVLGGVFP